MTSFRRRVPIRFLINQCQIITFLILKYDIIENSRIELRGIVLPVQMGGLLGGQRVYWPPSRIIGGLPPPPLPTPMCKLILYYNQKNQSTRDKYNFLNNSGVFFSFPVQTSNNTSLALLLARQSL